MEDIEMNLEEIDTSKEPPKDEPARQYYFMAKCREWVEKKSKEIGHPLTFDTTTFGCQMNARDSEKIRGILLDVGFVEAESEEADFVLYNTCTVRDNANQKVYGRLGYLNGYKKKNKEMKIALCGCMMQEPSVVEKIKKSYGFVDLIFGTHNLYKFAELLYETLNSDEMVIDVWEKSENIVEELPTERKYAFKSGVNIMFGCDNFCSYCIVPYVRGREKSREPKEILNEVETLAKDGVIEVMLLGQNVNSYGKNLEHPITFAELLDEVCKVDGIERVRFMTSHPKDLSDDLIRVIKENKKVCRHLHLPLQSGSSRLLKEMNRHYDKEQYLALVEKIKKAVPDISITTDIIVGYPGETEEDFLETMDVVEQVRFNSAFTFIYSPRTGTPAAKKEMVPEDIAKDRFQRLLKRVQTIGAEVSMEAEGSIQPVLVEQVNEQDATLVTGRMDNNSIVHFPAPASLIGTIVPVKLTQCKGFYYLGQMC